MSGLAHLEDAFGAALSLLESNGISGRLHTGAYGRSEYTQCNHYSLTGPYLARHSTFSAMGILSETLCTITTTRSRT